MISFPYLVNVWEVGRTSYNFRFFSLKKTLFLAKGNNRHGNLDALDQDQNMGALFAYQEKSTSLSIGYQPQLGHLVKRIL